MNLCLFCFPSRRLREHRRDALRPAGQPQQLLQPLDLHDLQRAPPLRLRQQPAVLPSPEGQVRPPGLGQQHSPDNAAVQTPGSAPLGAVQRSQPRPQKLSTMHDRVLTNRNTSLRRHGKLEPVLICWFVAVMEAMSSSEGCGQTYSLFSLVHSGKVYSLATFWCWFV